MSVRTVAVLSVVVGCLLASLASAQTAVVDDVALRNGGAADGEWLTVGLNLAETRYSPLKQIATENVSRLGLAWSYELGSSGGGQLATPLLWNGTLCTGQVAASTPTGRGAAPATGSIAPVPSPKLFTFVLDGNGSQTQVRPSASATLTSRQ
jgi:hypothetical protein